ncbi:MAG: MAC/perforin domain-containing protein [Pseudomonadota bacterium]
MRTRVRALMAVIAAMGVATALGHGQEMDRTVVWATAPAPKPTGPTPLTMPADIFSGCAEKAASSAVVAETRPPADRIGQRAEARQLGFELAAVSASQIDETNDRELKAACWARLDGVWRADRRISLDRSYTPEGWGSDVPDLIHLAHGTYIRPDQFIVFVEDGSDTLNVVDAFDPSRQARFTPNNAVALQDALKRGGDIKRYIASAKNDIGQTLSVDVTRSGLVRIRIDQQAFYRPQPGVRESQALPAVDAWLISYNLKNMTASRKGYDIVKQNGFFFLDNPKAEVFEEVDSSLYSIEEQRTVPLGLIFVPENTQGMVFSESLQENGSEISTTNTTAYGGKATLSAGDAAQAHVGYEYTRTAVENIKKNNTMSMAEGHARYKAYALVNDQPYATLSSAFIDAVEDARRYGAEDPSMYDDIIEKFGTHYPYAVTYGSAAKITQEFSRQEHYNSKFTSNAKKISAGASIFGNGGEGHYSKMSGQMTGGSGAFSDRGATFIAVGGNGSWDQNGFALGDTPYPILLDLRPIEELLSPMNFPGEPEVYQTVRAALSDAVSAYIAREAVPDVALMEAPFAELAMTTRGEYWVGSTGKVNLFRQKDYMTIEVGSLNGNSCPSRFFTYRRTSPTSNEFKDNKGNVYTFRDTGRDYVHRMFWTSGSNGNRQGLVHRGSRTKCR